MSFRRWIYGTALALSIMRPLGAGAAETPYVVVLLIDGARGDLVHDLAQHGKLPNIQKLFIDGGLTVDHGTTVFPTTSTNAYQSFMTGLFPGHAGIPYLARYSRPEQESVEYLSLRGLKIMNADLLNWYQLNDPNTPYTTTQGSLFNHLSDLKTASIYSTFQRDTGLQAPGLPLKAAWMTFVLGKHEALDTLAFKRLRKTYSAPMDRIPHLSLTAFLAVDILAHMDGAHAPRVIAQLEAIDRMIGEFWQLVESRGLADKTYLVLVGDHGNHDISERSYLRERLIKRGIAIRSRHMHPPYELAINARGVSAAIISVAGKDGWEMHPTLDDLHHVPTVKKQGEVNLIEYLRRQPETDLLLVRNGNHQVRIFSDTSESEITRLRSGDRYWYSYRLLHGSDPLHYIDDPKLRPLIQANTPLTAQQWLPLTAKKEYGDAIVQIGQIFTDGRVGDLMIVPKKEWVFRHEKANTHGSLLQEDLHIPIMMHGPNLAPTRIPYGRSVDVMPTILSWFDKTTPHRDGQNLLRPDPRPSIGETALARLEASFLAGNPMKISDKIPKTLLNSEQMGRQARLDKLTTLARRCDTGKVENRLTRPDRPKKIRVSTCEVVDLALKTTYEDLQRLNAIRGAIDNPKKDTSAAH